MQNPSATPVLLQCISDPEPAVRAAIIQSLGELNAANALGVIRAHLEDGDAIVRNHAIIALTKLESNPSPELITKLTGSLIDESRLVRVQSAIALGKLGYAERALPTLMDWINTHDEQTRIGALEAIGQAGDFFGPAFESGKLLEALQDASPLVRKAACHSFIDLTDRKAVEGMIACLSDEDEGVRKSAAEILRHHDELTQPYVLDLFNTKHPPVDAALDALTPRLSKNLGPLRLYARKEIGQAQSYRNWLASLPSTGRAVALIRKNLARQALRSEGRLIKIIGLLTSPETMELVRTNLEAANPESKSSALEALETVGDRELSKGMVALLEEKPIPTHPANVLDNLLKAPEVWSRALAIRAISELDLNQFLPKLHELQSDPHPLIRDALHSSLIELQEELPMTTIQTISTVERVLILQEIPIFTNLTPEDLERIALIAREQWHPAGDVIGRQGEEGDVMFVIVSGQVQIVIDSGGRPQALAERGPGDIIGEIAIIDPAPRSAGMVAKSETRLLAIEGEAFKVILRERPEVSLAVMQTISRRLKEMMEANRVF